MSEKTQQQPSGSWFYHRGTGQLEQEKVLGDFLLRFAYQSVFGKLLHWPLFANSLCSRLLGYYADSGISRGRIAGTVEQLGIDMSEVEIPEGGFRSFNDFFTRKLKAGARPLAQEEESLLSPADCRLLVYPQLSGDRCIPVKGAEFTVSELLGKPNAELVNFFRGGALCICRLCPADYHRYHFPADGEILDSWALRGKYHSVHPIALQRGLRVFGENLRQVSLLKLSPFGKMAFIEVGAFGVASIQQTSTGKSFRKGDEKGYFAFGGSTILMIFPPGRVTFSPDLVEKSQENIECLVRMGEEIGRLA